MKHALTVLALVFMSGPVAAQQVVAKGSWALTAPSDEGAIVIATFSTAASCVSYDQGMIAAGTKQLAQDQATFEKDNNNPAQPDATALERRIQAEYSLNALYASANCVQQ